MKHRATMIRNVGRYSAVQPERRMDWLAIIAGGLVLLLAILLAVL